MGVSYHPRLAQPFSRASGPLAHLVPWGPIFQGVGGLAMGEAEAAPKFVAEIEACHFPWLSQKLTAIRKRHLTHFEIWQPILGEFFFKRWGGRGGFCCLDHVPSSSMFPAWIIPRNWLKFIRSHWEVAGMFIIIFFLGWLSIMIYPLRFLIVGQSHYNDPLLLLVNPIIIHDNP